MRHIETNATLLDGRLVLLEVGYDVSGRHIPATYWQPAEGPEVSIETCRVLAVFDENGAATQVEPPDSIDVNQLSPAMLEMVYARIYEGLARGEDDA